MSDMGTGHLLIIGAYRDNEVEASHFVLKILDHIGKTGAVINTVVLSPLEPSHVNRLTADVMSCSLDQAGSLARICYEKTMGNPFFIYQLLTTFYDEKSLYFSPTEGIWRFDENAVKKAEITENVVDLMTGKIRRLGHDIQETLKIASCIGSSFDLSTLSLVSGKPESLTADLLFMALRENLLVPMDENYRFASESKLVKDVKYRFLHDRIQQAAYSLIPEDDKKHIHLKIGRILLGTLPKDDPGERLFDTVNHLDLAGSLITDPVEKERLSELNLLAGQKAKQSAAFKPAWEYFKSGIDLLGEKSWRTTYRHMLTLHNEALEALYLNGNYTETENLFQIIVKRTRTIMDKVKAYEIRILALISESRFKEALDTGMVILGLLGYRFPDNPRKWHLIAGLVKIKIALKKKSDEAILGAGAMSDSKVLAAAKLLHKMTSTALFSRPNLYPLIIFKRVEMSLKFGEDPLFSFSAYTSLGIIFCSIGRLEDGFRMGQLAETLLNRSKIKKERTRIEVVMNMFIRHWKDHLENTVKPLEQAIESRLETGDIEYASHAVSAYCLHVFHCGKPLKLVESEQRQYLTFIRILQQKFDVDNVCNFHQATLNLMDDTKPLTDYSGSSFDEKSLLPVLHEERNITALFSYNLNKLYLYYHAGEYEKAREHFSHVENYLPSVRALIVVVVYNFYNSLTRLALLGKGIGNRKLEIKQVEKNQKTMEKWALHAPMNHLHKWHLVEAEKARIMGLQDKAKRHYKEAVSFAGQNGYIQDEALSNERYAEFLFEQGDNDFAGLIMKKAQYNYGIWGASAKIAYLKKKWPQLTGSQSPSQGIPGSAGKTPDPSSTKITSSDALDMATILKASRMISREIVLSKLIEKILFICMENAGAEKCFVILEQNGRLFIEGEALTGDKSFQVLKSVPLEHHFGLSSHIVNYVARTKKILILDDAASEGDFTGDPYVVQNRPRSILCSAILNQGQISAILYMENNLSRAAFRLERMELLNALASQAAISINNARLYENLEDKVEERTRALNASLAKVEEANEHIMKSIRYSSVIQKSLLPAPGAVSEFLPDSFFIWKPRDIVGGDIYVCERLDRGIVISLIDCTGHGIPGAFMTMLASSGLRRIIREEKLFMPNEILKRLNHIIKTSLQQDTEHARSDDGLDAGVCCFDEESGNLYFSGARMPLYVVDRGELETVKGDRMSIGYVSSDLSYEFTVHEIENSRRDKRFYMATDGYTDQLGGKGSIRFGSASLKKLIVENHDKPFRKQAEVLKSALELHRGTRERTDDVTVAGFMFGGEKYVVQRKGMGYIPLS
jgi:predicted ATPase/serine phosphatase RsbU (regulator of sigma subunit)